MWLCFGDIVLFFVVIIIFCVCFVKYFWCVKIGEDSYFEEFGILNYGVFMRLFDRFLKLNIKRFIVLW